MKVKFTTEAKRYITIEEANKAHKIIEEMKEDKGIKDYAQMAAILAGGSGEYDILKVEAEISKNSNAFDYYGDGTGNLDIWLNIYAFNYFTGFFVIGAYLSDIWSIADDNKDEIRERMYIKHYKKVAE